MLFLIYIRSMDEVARPFFDALALERAHEQLQADECEDSESEES